MKTYSVVEVKVGNRPNAKTSLFPQVNVRYSCTDEMLCYEMLDKKAISYLKDKEELSDFKKSNSYYIPNRKNNFDVSLYVKESDVLFNSNHEDELTDLIGGLYDRIAKLMIVAGEKVEKDDMLEFHIPINMDMLELATGYDEIVTDDDYVVMGVIYESYDNGKGENGSILLNVGLDEPMDIINLSNSMVVALADYLENYYERIKDNRLI